VDEVKHVYHEWEHPRGRDGQWIDKGGRVKVFRSPTDAKPILGVVADVREDGIVVKPDSGEPFLAQAHQVEEDKSVARLDAPRALPAPAGMRPASDEERRQLKVPPAWTSVHVASDPNAGLRVWALDAKGRGQYRYSDEHWAKQNEKKFARMKALHEKLPALDSALQRDVPTNDTAAAVLLMRTMGVRNGSETDTGAEKFAYGATNLRVRHVLVDGDDVTLDFDGKDGVHLTLPVRDEKVKAILRDRARGKGPDDRIFNTNEVKTNAYLKRITGGDFKVKDLRTYVANSIALQVMATMPKPTTLAQFKKERLEVAKEVAAILGNTPAIALKSYISPAVFASWTVDVEWSV
jgi:DNA topoisomerase-1